MAATGNDPTPNAARPRGRGRVYASISDAVGDTPLVRVDRLAREKGVRANLLRSSSSSIPPPA